MRFAQIPGNEEIKQRLRNMVDNDQLPHALLIYGKRGTGKLMLARALATYLHCSNPTPDGDSCGKCPSCIQHAANSHVDLHYTFPTLKKGDEPGASSDYLEQWVEFLDEDPYADITVWLQKLDKPNGQPVIYLGEANALAKNLSFTPRATQHKVAIIWLPERFRIDTANKLLKLVEEPFPDTKMIFVSDNARDILPTIYSRLQRIEAPQLPDSVVAAEVQRCNPGISEQEAMDIAHAADGDVIEARSMQGEDNSQMLRQFILLMRLAFQRKVGELKDWAEEMANSGREQHLKFLAYCCRLMRENFINNTGIAGLTRMMPAEAEFGAKFSKFINSRNVLGLIKEFEQAASDIAANSNTKIVFFELSIRVILLIKP